MTVRLAVVGVAAAVAVSPGASAAPLRTISPAQIERALAAGRPVIEHNVMIRGDVNLRRNAGRVRSVFVCNRCTFAGSIDGRHVVFEREIDLGESNIEGSLNLHGALFREPALFNQTEFGGDADFAFAAFNDLAMFRLAHFAAAARFTSAHFRSVARFGETTFARDASFGDAIFSAEALFPLATFSGVALFADADFGDVTDFRKAFFERSGDFNRASFAGRAEFGQALINQAVLFSEARFGGDALFLGTAFGILPSASGDPGVRFENAVVRGRIDLQGAVLKRSAHFNQVSANSLSFDGIVYDPSSWLQMTGVAANSISLDLDDIQHLEAASAEARAILHTAEETAKSAGNLGLANDLHYRLQEIARGDDVWPRRIGDHVFYRSVAGYFVRPFRPLYWLLALVLLAAVIRALRGSQIPSQVEPKPKTGEPGPVRRAWFTFARALDDTLRRGGNVQAEPKPLRRLELTVYAVLLACFVLALANTNPTLRDMFDAIV